MNVVPSSASKSTSVIDGVAQSPATPPVIIVRLCLPLLSLSNVKSNTPEPPGAIVIRPPLSLLKVAPYSNSSTTTLMVFSSEAV